MVQSIPASEVVNVTTGVVSAGGTALDLSGLILTNSTRSPLGTVVSFATPADVASYFGGSTTEAQMANVYFSGFDGSDLKPGALLFAQYNTAAVAAYIRSGPGITLAEVQTITSGTLAITSNGTLKTSSALNLSSAVSLSAAAATITAAFTTPGFTITYDSLSAAFLVTSSTTGTSSTLVVTTSAVATTLGLTAAVGAVTSPGAAAGVPGTAMSAVIAQNQDFATFTTAFEPASDQALLFAAWTDSQKNRYGYASWDTDVNNASPASTTILAYQIAQANYSGTMVSYAPVNTFLMGAFGIGFGASLDFSATNGRADICDRTQSGLPADVTDSVTYNAVLGNGVNCFAAFGTANAAFLFYRKGTVSGDFKFWDSYINQIWLSNGLQLAGMSLLAAVKNIPYTSQGDALIASGLQGPIDDGLNFGAIRAGVVLSDLEITVVNNSAGQVISDILQTRGWYLQIKKASAQDRAARSPRQIVLWYTDGQSVQGLNITSLEVQ